MVLFFQGVYSFIEKKHLKLSEVLILRTFYFAEKVGKWLQEIMEIEKRTLTPVSGFSREIGFYLCSWDKSRKELRETVFDLSNEELSQRILPGSHQIGGLILHLGEAESWWIHSIIAGQELDDVAKKFAHWYDTTETDFAEKGYDAKNCFERIDEISRISGEIMQKFDDSNLKKLFAYDRGGKRIEVSL